MRNTLCGGPSLEFSRYVGVASFPGPCPVSCCFQYGYSYLAVLQAIQARACMEVRLMLVYNYVHNNVSRKYHCFMCMQKYRQKQLDTICSVPTLAGGLLEVCSGQCAFEGCRMGWSGQCTTKCMFLCWEQFYYECLLRRHTVVTKLDPATKFLSCSLANRKLYLRLHDLRNCFNCHAGRNWTTISNDKSYYCNNCRYMCVCVCMTL